MPDRKTTETVTFLHPFSLTAIDEPISAGTYIVETLEEMIAGLSFVAYRRVSTSITIASKLYGAAARQVIEIDPLELEYALKCDKERDAVTEPEHVDLTKSGLQH